MVKWLCPLVFVLLVLAGCVDRDKPISPTTGPDSLVTAQRFIVPPIPGADVPYTQWTVQAEKGDTLFPETGSIVLFPPNAFVDIDGKAITGAVQVTYREFTDPLDFFLAGIPMNYDSAGTGYVFESAGMFQLAAYKDGQPVFVNQRAKPDIYLAQRGKLASSNLYYLDTAAKKWVNKAGAERVIMEPGHSTSLPKPGIEVMVTVIPEPVKPGKANGKNPVLEVEVDPNSFAELLVYHNLKFQLLDGEPFDPKDSEEEWENVQLKDGPEWGIYIVQFSNKKKTVSYKAKPVLEGADYDKAIQVYEQKRKEYDKVLADRLVQEKAVHDKRKQDSANNALLEREARRIEQLNVLIDARNKAIEKQNAEIREENKLIALNNKEVAIRRKEVEKKIKLLEAESQKQKDLYEKQLAVMKAEYEKAQQEAEKAEVRQRKPVDVIKLVNKVSIERFGIWNCDQPLLLNTITVNARFTDTTGKELSVTSITMFYKGVNGILSVPDGQLRIMRGAPTMVAGVSDRKLVYITYKDFSNIKIDKGVSEITVPVTIVPEKNNNYRFIKRLALE